MFMKKEISNKEKTTESKTKKNKNKNKTKKKKIFIIILVCIIIIIGVIISLTFILKDDSKKVIKFDTTYNDIYSWKPKIDNNKIVKIDEKKRVGDLENKNGGYIIEKYIIKALKPGKTYITFTYTNKNNGSFGEIKTYKAVVDKNLKLTISKTKNR